MQTCFLETFDLIWPFKADQLERHFLSKDLHFLCLVLLVEKYASLSHAQKFVFSKGLTSSKIFSQLTKI